MMLKAFCKHYITESFKEEFYPYLSDLHFVCMHVQHILSYHITFLEFGSLSFLEIAYNDSLQQCLTSKRRKTHEKNFRGPNLGQTSPNRARN